MPLPTAAELTDPNATNTQMKQRLGQLVEGVASKELVDLKVSETLAKIANKRIIQKYVNIYIENLNSGQVANSLSTARSQIVRLKPNTKYWLEKTINTDRYIVGLYKGLPYGPASSVANFERLVKNSIDDGITTGLVEFETGSQTLYAIIYTSRSDGDEVPLTLFELNNQSNLGIPNYNLCDPTYIERFSISFNSLDEPVISRYATNSTYVMPCNAGQVYNVLRKDSNRFAICFLIQDPLTKKIQLKKHGDFTNLERVVITCPVDSIYLFVYYSSNNLNAKLQITVGEENKPFKEFAELLADKFTLSEKQSSELITQASNAAFNSVDAFLNLDDQEKLILSDDFLAVSANRDASGNFSSFSNQANARTYFIEVEPNTKYILNKFINTPHYIVVEHRSFPLMRQDTHFIRNIHDSDATLVTVGELQFETSADAKWISVMVSVSTSETSELKLVKSGYIGPMFKKTRNLADPLSANIPSTITYQDTVTNPFSGANTSGQFKTFAAAVKPNTSYVLSLSKPTSRFRAILVNKDSSGVRIHRNLSDTDGQTVLSFTTDSNTFLFALYYTNTGENPGIQLEEGLEQTALVKYGYIPNFSFNQNSGNLPIAVIDHNYDVTEQLKSAFAQSENTIVYISPGEYGFNQTLNIPSNSKIIGLGRVILKLLSTDNLETVVWRGSNVKTYLKSHETSNNAYLENIKVVGSDMVDKSYLHFGICMQGLDHKLVNVSTDHINWEISEETEGGERRSGGNGWGLTFYRAKRGRVNGGRFTYGGYENIGTDNAEDIIFDGIYCGIGWRTSFQVHRASKDIKLINSKVEQERSSYQTHSAVTIHGNGANVVDGVLIDGNTIISNVEESWANRGGIQSVEGWEHNVTITNNTIKTNNWGVCAGEGGTVKEWIVSNNRIYAQEKGVRIRGKNALVTGNIIKANSHVEFYGADATTCVEVNNTFLPQDE